MVQGISRRLGRREPAGRQARLPAARRSRSTTGAQRYLGKRAADPETATSTSPKPRRPMFGSPRPPVLPLAAPYWSLPWSPRPSPRPAPSRWRCWAVPPSPSSCGCIVVARTQASPRRFCQPTPDPAAPAPYVGPAAPPSPSSRCPLTSFLITRRKFRLVSAQPNLTFEQGGALAGDPVRLSDCPAPGEQARRSHSDAAAICGGHNPLTKGKHELRNQPATARLLRGASCHSRDEPEPFKQREGSAINGHATQTFDAR